MQPEPDETLVFLPAALADCSHVGPSVVIVRTREEFVRALEQPPAGAQWLQVECLLGDPEVWAIAAQGTVTIPLDVIVGDPAAEFSNIYRLVDMRIVRDVRLTIPVRPGCMKAL